MLFVQSSTDKPPLSCADAAVTADNRWLSGVSERAKLGYNILDSRTHPNDSSAEASRK